MRFFNAILFIFSYNVIRLHKNVKAPYFFKAYTMESKTVFLIVIKSMSVKLRQKPDIISIKLVLSFHFLYLEEYSDN